MNVTTKAVKNLPAERLQELFDDGYCFVSTRATQQALAEIVEIGRSTIRVQLPDVAYVTPIRLNAVSAVHKPEELTSI